MDSGKGIVRWRSSLIPDNQNIFVSKREIFSGGSGVCGVPVRGGRVPRAVQQGDQLQGLDRGGQDQRDQAGIGLSIPVGWKFKWK